jgi:hypothetical protein
MMMFIAFQHSGFLNILASAELRRRADVQRASRHKSLALVDDMISLHRLNAINH